ncbi:(S)-coclaurine N-methyltransferase-like [Lotus japonicus]|uniref:(S)-coclaurine N-methyltransferase-like n=1 Tax=Lotus japonicus TaxID=34305 RepID=UPI002584B055|nr:(S)-coclaurine N-methyltransferase-like [Lotus japonicus]
MYDTLTALQDMPIAVSTNKAKSQHYELPTSFFRLVLGKNLKYRMRLGITGFIVAKNYRSSRVTGICNSITQKAYIEEKCQDLQLQNLDIIVADISTFEMEASYDRIYSIGMFEHMKNYKDLLKKISRWMKEDGLLFVHHFCHNICLPL